jgi:hypothetical protein
MGFQLADLKSIISIIKNSGCKPVKDICLFFLHAVKRRQRFLGDKLYTARHPFQFYNL